MPGLRKLNQRAASVASVTIQIEIAAKDALLPIGSVRNQHDGTPIRGNAHRIKTHRIKKLIEGQRGFLRLRETGKQQRSEDERLTLNYPKLSKTNTKKQIDAQHAQVAQYDKNLCFLRSKSSCATFSQMSKLRNLIWNTRQPD